MQGSISPNISTANITLNDETEKTYIAKMSNTDLIALVKDINKNNT